MKYNKNKNLYERINKKSFGSLFPTIFSHMEAAKKVTAEEKKIGKKMTNVEALKFLGYKI